MEARADLKYRAYFSPQGQDRLRSDPRQGRRDLPRAILQNTPNAGVRACCYKVLMQRAARTPRTTTSMDPSKLYVSKVMRHRRPDP